MTSPTDTTTRSEWQVVPFDNALFKQQLERTFGPGWDFEVYGPKAVVFTGRGQRLVIVANVYRNSQDPEDKALYRHVTIQSPEQNQPYDAMVDTIKKIFFGPKAYAYRIYPGVVVVKDAGIVSLWGREDGSPMLPRFGENRV